jgi:xanthine dehydrogenase accessory factor
MIRGSVARRAEQLAHERVPFVEAMVVRAQRPTSVHPGDSAIVLADGTIDGFVGGICAEASVRLHALRVLETGEPLLLRLIPGDSGEARDSDPGDGAVIERNPCLSGGSLEIFLEPRLPASRIVVIGGAAPIARALAELAAAAGYDVVCGSSEELSPSPADAAVIVASHGSGEERALAAALAAGVPYVALVASAARGEAVRAALAVPDELRAQLHTPAGLKIGARSPQEVAIAILAELVSEHHAHPAPAAAVAPGPASARDPICGMEVAVTAATIHHDIDGERAYFCCEGCRAAYAARHAGDAPAR